MNALTPLQADQLRQHHGLTICYGAQHAYIGTIAEPLDSRSMLDIACQLTQRAVAAIESAESWRQMALRPDSGGRKPRGTFEQRIDAFLVRAGRA